MAPTIQQMLTILDQQHRAADRRRQAATERAQALLSRVKADGREYLSAHEDALMDSYIGERDRAGREVEDLAAQLAEFRAAQAGEAETARRQAETHDTGVRLPGHGAQHELGRGRTAQDRGDGPAPWTRQSDGRRATLARGERFADHEIVREHAERMAASERPITETHGGIGQLLRALATTGSGAALVPTTWSANIIDRARNAAQVLAAGTEVVPMDSKVVQIGRLTTDPTSAFRAEGSTITASDPVFDSVTLTATSLTCLTVASMEYLQDAIGADSVIEDAIGKSMGLALDLNCLYGGITSGAEGLNLPTPPAPRGILANLLANLPANVLGAQTNGTVPTAATPWNEILSLIYTPRRSNEVPNALLWPVRLQQGYAQRYDTLNQPLRQPDDVAAIEKLSTNQLASGMTQGTGTNMCDAVCGDFTKAILGQRLDFQVRVLTERYADAGQVGIVSYWRGDFQLARPGAFAWYRYLQGAA